MKMLGYIFYKEYIINVEDSLDIISFNGLEDYILKNYERVEVINSIDFLGDSDRYKGIGIFNILVKSDSTGDMKDFSVNIWYDLEERCYYFYLTNWSVHHILENFVFKDSESKAIPDIDELMIDFCENSGIKWFEKNIDYKRRMVDE